MKKLRLWDEESQLAFAIPSEEAENVWLEPVTDEEYNRYRTTRQCCL